MQVPVELHPNRQRFLAIRWLIVAARERPGKGMGDKLALELLDAYNNEVCIQSACGVMMVLFK